MGFRHWFTVILQAVEGRILGAKYRVIRLARDGEAGDLYEGVHDDLEKPVSIYIPTMSGNGPARFAAIATRVSSVAALRVVDFGVEDDGVGYLVTEPLSKPPLEQRLAATGPIPTTEAARVAIAVLDVLAATHACDVVHGALTIEHIGWDGTNVDVWGFAIGDTPSFEDSSPDTTAPELLHALPADPRTDVFSVGILLRELTGRTATSELTAIIQRATAPSLDVRYQTARAMRLELATLTGEATGPDMVRDRTFQSGSVPGANITQSILPAPPKSSRTPGIVMAAIVVLLIGIAIGLGPKLLGTDTGELAAAVDAGDYGAAEAIALQQFDTLHEDPETTALMRQSLAERRRNEPEAPAYDPNYVLRASRWDGFVIYDGGNKRDPIVIVIDQVGSGWIKGFIEAKRVGVRARLVGYWSGNHLVMWDDELISGSNAGRRAYQLYEKTSVYIDGEDLVGLPGAIGSSFEAKFVGQL